MADGHLQAGFIRELLQFRLPKPCPVSIASTTKGQIIHRYLLAATFRFPRAIRFTHRDRSLQFTEATVDHRARYAGCLGDGRDPPVTQRFCFGCENDSLLFLTQMRQHQLERLF